MMSLSSDIQCYVLSAPGREQTTKKCLDSIEASDIGDRYTLCANPPGKKAFDHWRDTMLKMASDDGPPFVVLFEDDCLVNKHFLWNVRTWKAPLHPKFGAGWLYSPGGWAGGGDVWYQGPAEWYGTIAVGYWRRDVRSLTEWAWHLMQQRRWPWDCAISKSVLDHHKWIRQHGPPLCEHMHTAPSIMGNPTSWAIATTRGGFKPEWKRGIRDHLGPWAPP